MKNEYERPVDRNEFPLSALQTLDSLNIDHSTIRYFEEMSNNTFSYEAKTDLNGDQYSIEFSRNGTLEDVEKLILFDELSEPSLQRITDYLNSAYTSYNVIRTQLQYTSDQLDDIEIIKNILENDLNNITSRIEIEVEARNRRELGYFELLFDDRGEIIQRKRIFKRSIDNIW